VKATVPRFRYDQLMRLGWKIFLPISLLWVFLISGYLMLTKEQCPTDRGDLATSPPMLRPTATSRPAAASMPTFGFAALEPDHDQALDQVLLPLGVREGARADAEIFLQAEGDAELPL
jgi:hypothetical protein